MAVGTFTITELLRRNASRDEAETGEIFRWTSDRTPPEGGKGGARATPQGAWTFGGELRTVRTDYPGARTPSEQVLGPQPAPQSLSGRWDDRYNFPGYAIGELRRFEAMCRRGNMVRVQFQNQTFEGIILRWTFDYRREWYIQYAFELSTHDRPEDFNLSDRVPQQPKSVQEVTDEMDQIVLATIESFDVAPRSSLSTDLATDSTTDLAAIQASQNSLVDTVDVKEFDVGTEGTIGPFKRIATQMRSVQRGALDLIDGLVMAKSDIDLGVRTAQSVLDFEEWSRTARFNARILMGTSSQGARDIEERDEPQALALYRPSKGESLYNVSRRFYGTPHSWRLIADRNALQEILLTGEELLIIPERGEG